MNTPDEYATLRAAESAGARIQAYTLHDPVNTEADSAKPLSEVDGHGYWRTLDAPMIGNCHPTRYRIHPEDVK